MLNYLLKVQTSVVNLILNNTNNVQMHSEGLICNIKRCNLKMHLYKKLKTNTEQIVLSSRPNDLPALNNLKFKNIELREIKTGQVLLKSMYHSVDPYMHGRMNDAQF